MSVSTNDLKNGMTLDLDGTLFQVIEFQHVKPGKGGAFVRTKLRNVRSGAVVERTFNAGVKVGLAIVERKDMQYLYRDEELAAAARWARLRTSGPAWIVFVLPSLTGELPDVLALPESRLTPVRYFEAPLPGTFVSALSGLGIGLPHSSEPPGE